MTLTGRVVKSIGTTFFASGNHNSEMTWDGRDMYGDKLGSGVYLYHLEVKSEAGQSHKSTGKLYKIH